MEMITESPIMIALKLIEYRYDWFGFSIPLNLNGLIVYYLREEVILSIV